MMSIRDEEEYKDRLERARQLRNSVGMITEKDRNENEMGINIKSSSTQTVNTPVNSLNDNSIADINSDYENKLQRARELRNSIGMITQKDKEIEQAEKQLDVNINANSNSNKVVNNGSENNSVQQGNDNKQLNSSEDYSEMLKKMDTEELKENGFTEEQIKYIKEADTDEGFFSSWGKIVENLWLGAWDGMKNFASYLPNLTEFATGKEQNNSILSAGTIANSNKIASIVQNAQKNEKDDKLLVNAFAQKTKEETPKAITLEEKNGTKPILNQETEKNIKNELGKYTYPNGDVEVNPIQETIKKDQEKIASNTNQISSKEHPALKKISELAPSMGNSLVGGGLMLIPGVGKGISAAYFMISAAGSYEADGRNRGMTEDEAKVYGGIMGIMEGATETISVQQLGAGGSALGKGAIKSALKYYGLSMADNAIQEAIIDPIDEFTANTVSGKTRHDYSTSEGWLQLGQDMVTDAIDGALSALLLDGMNAGLNAPTAVYNKVKNNQHVSQKELQSAYKEIQDSDSDIDIENEFKKSIDFEMQKIKNHNGTYRITNTDNNGNIIGIQEANGELIDFNNDKINIVPAVVYNDGYYNVIDAKTGTKLDTTPYENKQNAIDGFNDKISNIDDATINNINNQVTKMQISLANKIQEIEKNALENPEEFNSNTYIKLANNERIFSQQELVDYLTEQERKNQPKTASQDLRDVIGQVQDKSIYSNKRTNEIMNSIANKFDNVTYANSKLTVTDNQGNIKYSKDIKTNQPGYTGKTIKNILNNVYNNVMSENNNANAPQTSSEQNASTFYTNKGNNYTNDTGYAVRDIKKVTQPFDAQETYSKDEMADVWNNSIAQNNYDAYYGKDGNIERYIAIEEEGDNLVVNQYDSNDNIVKSDVIPSENGRYKASDIKDTIEKVSSLYDENRPIKGQRDIEGNEVLSMKKNKKEAITNRQGLQLPNSESEASNKSISQNNDIIKSIERFKKAKNKINRQDVINVANNLNVYHRGTTFIDDKMAKKSGNNVEPRFIKVDKYFTDFIDKEDLRKQAYDYAMNNHTNKTVTIKDINSQVDIPQKGIKKTFGKNQDNNKMQTAPKLLDIIEESVYLNSSISTKNSVLKYHYFYTPISVDNNNRIALITIKEDTTNKKDNDKFYYHDIREIGDINELKEGKAHAMPHKNVSNMLFEQSSPSINNSIPQNTKSVKNNTAINKQSMQNVENNALQQENIKKELHKRIQNALISKNSQGRTYLGDVSNKIADKVKSLFGFDVSDKRHVLADNDIRHMIKEHGNPILEKQKGQIAITTKDIEKIPDILANYNRIVQGNDNREGKTIRYIKKYSDNISYVVEVVPEKGKALKIKTMWKKPARVTNGQKTPNLTSKTKPNLGISTSNTSIAQNSQLVKNDDVRSMKKNTGNTVQNNNTKSTQQTHFAKKTAKPDVEILDPGATNAQREGSYIEQEIRKIEQTGNWDNSIPVTKMTDIRKTIEDYLGLGVQKGHFREQAYGIYKGNRDVIRTKELKDIDTILHETGHALDIGKRINLNKESISNELLNAVNKYGGYEAETREVQLEEGFAEVIREYSIVPDQAKIDYPQTVSVIEGIMQENADFNNFIKTVQHQTYNYIHQNPRNRILSNQSIGEITKRTPSNLKQEIMRNVYDKDWAVKSAVNEMQKLNGKTTQDLKASENAYYLTRLASGIGDKVTSMLSKGYIDENGNKLMPGLDSIGELLNNNPDRFNDLRTLLAANRDLDYKAKTLKTGMRTNDAITVREQFKNDIPLQESAKLFYDTLDGVLQYTVNNGLITQENADMIRKSNAFYAPMQRVLEGNRNNVGRKGAVADIIKTRTGSELDIKDVLENAISNSVNMIQQVENNNILKAFYKQGEQAGMTGKIYDIIPPPMKKIGTAQLATWETELRKQGVDTTKIDLEKTIDLFAPNNKVDSNNLITSFINDDGKRVYLQFHDEILFNSLMNMDKTFMSAVLNINRKLNMPLRYGATMANLGFAIPNVISDTAQAAIFSEAGFIPVLDNVIGVMDIVSAQNKGAREFFNKIMPGYADRINTLYAIYEQTGATNSTRMSQYRESTQITMKDVYGTKNSEVLGIKEKYKPLKRLLDILTYIPEVSEQSTRFRVFEKNLEYYRRNGMAETDARIQAALQSRDATQDFSRTGNITREINQLIPFSAARVGSAYTFAEKVKANPKRVASRMAVLMAISMAIKAIGYDDKEIEELNQRKKDDNFVFKIGDQIITIKKPQGILRSIINLGEYVQDLFTGHIEEGKEGERLVEWATNSIMDNMPADSVTGLVPNMIAPVVENAINKDLYYNSDIVKSYDLELPDSEQYYDYNSQLAIWLGKIFNYSPAKIDNLISGYFAGLGTSVTNVIDWISGKMGVSPEEPDNGLEDNAVGKRFFVNVNTNSQSVDEIYDLKTDLTKKSNGGTITPEEKTQLEAITEAISNISKINKQVKEIKADLSMSGKEKAEQIDILQRQKVDTARQALGKELLYSENEKAIESTKFYPSRDTLSQNKRTLTLTPEMKKEYEELASEYYSKYEKQGLYSEEKLEQLKSKAKEYAKKSLMKKYRNELVKDE